MTIASTTDLVKSLTTAAAGTVIALAPGSYDHLRYAPTTALSGPVTITAADPTNPPDFHLGIEVRNTGNLTFSGLKVGREDAASVSSPLVQLVNCHDITLDGMTYSGVDKGATGYLGYGVAATGVDGLTLIRGKTDHVYRVATIGSCKRVLVADNDHAFFQGDAYQLVSVTGVQLLRNLFEKCFTFGVGHVDLFQFMIRAASYGDIPSTDIVIEDNFCGNDPFNGHCQFVFVKSEDTTKRFQNVTVQRNISYGTNWNAHNFIGVDGLLLNENYAYFVAAANSTITDAEMACSNTTGIATNNHMTKSSLDKALLDPSNVIDRLKMTATLADMAAAKAAWSAKFRAPPVRPAATILSDMIANASANAKLIDELRASIGASQA